MDVDRARLAVVGAAAEPLEQLTAGEDASRRGRENAEELELDEGQLRFRSAHLDRSARHVDSQLAGLDHLVVAPLPRPWGGSAAQQRPHPAAELPDREGLGDVVVGAELEPEHLVEFVVPGGEHDDGDGALGPEPLAHLEPVELRQHQVEDDEIHVLLGEARERLLAVTRVDDAEPVALERVAQELLDGVFVVNEEDGRRIGHATMLKTPAAFPTLAGAMTPPRRVRAPRGRRRRGSIERPVNARLVRGTWLLVALPLLLTAFSVARPAPLPAPTLPATFDGGIAEQLSREMAREYPDRSPGSPAGLGAADWVQDQLELYGFTTRVDRFRTRIPGRGEVELRNLVTVVRGDSPRAIVITAHRDNSGEGSGANDNASGTGALIELARAYATVGGASLVQARPNHTLVFVSTDGGAFGGLGTAHFAESSPYRDNALAVISLDAIAGAGRPRLLIGGDTARSPSPALVRTAALRVLEQTGSEPRREPALRQLLDLGFPFTLGEQGPFVARGIPAVTLTTLADGAANGFEDTGFDVQRLAAMGRASQNLIGSLDAGLELAQGTTSYVDFGTRIVRGWALELVLLTALLPFLIGAVDLFAHCRRRRIPLAPAARSLRTRLLFWGFAAALTFVAALLGAFPKGEARPLPPDPRLYEPSAVVLGILGTLLLVGWLGSRERLIPRRPIRPDETLAGHTVALLALGLLALLVVATNPFSLVYLLPSLYAWLWLPQAQASGPLARAGLLVLGFAGPLILLLSFSTRLELGLRTPWYLLSLVSVGYVPWIVVALGCVWIAIAAQLTALAVGRYAPYSADRRQRPRRPLRLLTGRGTGEERDALER
jgi:hypothetical protein